MKTRSAETLVAAWGAVSCRATIVAGVTVVIFGLLSALEGQTVHIPDPELRTQITQSLELEPEELITVERMATLTAFEADDDQEDITDLSGLEYATNLESLEITDSGLTHLRPLSNLTSLRVLVLDSDTAALDLTPIRNLTKLEVLVLHSPVIDDLAPLAGLTKLRTLRFNAGPNLDLAHMSGFLDLEELFINGVTITPTTALYQMPRLRHVSMHRTRGGVSPLLVVPAYVETLVLDESTLSDLTPLIDFADLKLLSLRQNKIRDLSPLANLSKLASLDLDHNRVSDLTPLAGLESLQSLHLAHNPVRSLEALRNLTNLSVLRLWNAPLTTLEPIADLPNLVSLSTTGTFLDLAEGGAEAGYVAALRERASEVAVNPQREVAEVVFEDQSLEGSVRLASGRTEDENALTTVDMASLSVLIAPNSGIANIDPLQYAVNLQELDLRQNAIADLSPLAGLRQLTEANVEGTGEVDTEVFLHTTFLREAKLGRVKDLAGLINRGRLEVLSASGPSLWDLRPIRYLRRMRELTISDSSVADLEALRGLSNLEWLEANRTNIVFLNPLHHHRQLRTLRMADGNVRSLAPIREYQVLDELDARSNAITDFTPLEGIRFTGSVRLEGNYADITPGSPSRQTMEILQAQAPNGPDSIQFELQLPAPPPPLPHLRIEWVSPNEIVVGWPNETGAQWIVFAAPDLDRWESPGGTVWSDIPGGNNEFSEIMPEPASDRFFIVVPVKAR